MVYSYTIQSADVYPYNSSYDPIKDVPIVTGATTFTDEKVISYIILINEALYCGDKLDHSLLNPNQIHHNNIGYWNNPYVKDNPLGIEIMGTLFIPLKTKGTKTTFNSKISTSEDLENCLHIELTSAQEWNLQELNMTESVPI